MKATFLTCVAMVAGVTALQAAPVYSLNCETVRGQAIALTLTSFTFHVAAATTGIGEGSAGMGAGRREPAQLTIRFAMGHEYDVLEMAAENNEVLRNCKLTEGGAMSASGGAGSRDSWNEMSMGDIKGNNKNKNKGNAPAQGAVAGTAEWMLNNAVVTSVSAIGTEASSTAPAEGQVEATITAQNYTFAMQ